MSVAAAAVLRCTTFTGSKRRLTWRGRASTIASNQVPKRSPGEELRERQQTRTVVRARWVRVGPLSWTSSSGIVAGDRLVPITSKTFDVLVVLLEQRDDIVSKDEPNRVWRDTAVNENNLARQISSLRRALGQRRPARFCRHCPWQRISIRRHRAGPAGSDAGGPRRP